MLPSINESALALHGRSAIALSMTIGRAPVNASVHLRSLWTLQLQAASSGYSLNEP